MTYPFKIKVTPSTLAAWREDELASFEDHGGASDHPHAILGRHARAIEVRTPTELARLIESGRYHSTDGCWDDRGAYRAAVGRIVQRLRGS